MSEAAPAPPRQPPRLLATVRRYRMPSATRLMCRRWVLRFTKLVLPGLALALLASLALWPEFQRVSSQAAAAAKSFAESHGDTVMDARYRSVDQHGRPFTITAAVAKKVNDDRIDLTRPKGDITLKGGTWVMLQAKKGVYRQHENSLDLSDGVTLYRDDGTIVRSRSATIDLKGGAAAGAQPVHATGPFGKLDAAGGFTAADSGKQMFFAGPATLLLNGANSK